jgi:hypothetical protein
MKRGFLSPGLRVWIIAQILFIVWAILGSEMGIPVRTISVFGSIGMVLFVILALSAISVLRRLNLAKGGIEVI